MANLRMPGPLGLLTEFFGLDDGTLARIVTPRRGAVDAMISQLGTPIVEVDVQLDSAVVPLVEKAPAPIEFLHRYQNLVVGMFSIQLRTYFIMKSWETGTPTKAAYDFITSTDGADSIARSWFRDHQEGIRNAAMGKGSPDDYRLALEWALRSGKTQSENQSSLQAFCDARLGIDCSGLVTNYLIGVGKRVYSKELVRNTNAASYSVGNTSVNDPRDIRQGDLLVWMSGDRIKKKPGHIAIVDAYWPQCRIGGNMRVVEATDANGATPKLLSSMYTVEDIESRSNTSRMVLKVKRHGKSGARVCVVRA